MTYVINNYNGSPLVSIPDRTVNLTATSIKLPGRDYPRYGEPVVEDLVWMLQNFANTNPPLHPIDGQIWYNTTEKTLKVYDATTSSWLGTGQTAYGNAAPANPSNGQLWFDTGTKQLKSWDVSTWRLIGPIGTANNTDPLGLVAPAYTAVEAMTCTDNTNTVRNVLRITVNGTVIAVISDASFSCQAGAVAGSSLTSVSKGINLTNAAVLVGNASTATTALDSQALGGKVIGNFYLTDQTNEPTADNTFNLGASGKKYANVYATLFNGTATSARYADLAERYHADAPLQAGMLVMLGGECEITVTTQQGSSDVFGVVSTNPGLMLNSHAGSDDSWPYVALAGRVPVKVVGIVKKGQRLMSSDQAGVAQAWDPQYGLLAIVGRSLMDKPYDDVDTILAVVGTK